MKIELITRIHSASNGIETNKEFQNRINAFLSTHKCFPPVFLSVDFCQITYEEETEELYPAHLT
jgi:hypothetical protein